MSKELKAFQCETFQMEYSHRVMGLWKYIPFLTYVESQMGHIKGPPDTKKKQADQ